MDPDATLAEIRRAFRNLQYSQAEMLFYYLDDWLSNGGRHPEAWAIEENNNETDQGDKCLRF